MDGSRCLVLSLSPLITLTKSQGSNYSFPVKHPINGACLAAVLTHTTMLPSLLPLSQSQHYLGGLVPPLAGEHDRGRDAAGEHEEAGMQQETMKRQGC